MSKRILVIEDQEDNRQIVRDLVTASGYELIEATTGEEGIEAAARERPDLILMDIQLPGIDGYEVTRRIKANPQLLKIPIIAVTSYALSGDDKKAFAAGCDGYVTKPYSPRLLLADVTNTWPEGRALHHPPRILVVDDTPANVEILRQRLEMQGLRDHDRGRRRGGPGAVREQEPDLILLDVMMPKLDRIEVCRRSRATGALPFIPIILVTARSDTRDVVGGSDAGATST